MSSNAIMPASSANVPATFDAFQEIGYKLLEMQRQMEGLEAENLKLREELAALRSGRRVYLLIEGRKFGLDECLPDGDTQGQKSEYADSFML